MPVLSSASSATPGGTSLLIFLLPLLLLGYLIFSQRRRQKQMTQMQASLQVGDAVMTTAGMHGTVVSLEEQTARLQIAEGVVVVFDRRAVIRQPQAATPQQPPAADPGPQD